MNNNDEMVMVMKILQNNILRNNNWEMLYWEKINYFIRFWKIVAQFKQTVVRNCMQTNVNLNLDFFSVRTLLTKFSLHSALIGPFFFLIRLKLKTYNHWLYYKTFNISLIHLQCLCNISNISTTSLIRRSNIFDILVTVSISS